MSLELTLLPVECEVAGFPPWGFSHSMLRCDLGGLFFQELKQVPRVQLPRLKGFVSRQPNQEIGYGWIDADPYGSPLVGCLAGHLVQAPLHEDLWVSSRNRAVWAYLRALDPNTKIALYWH